MNCLGIYLLFAYSSFVATVFHNEMDLERLKEKTSLNVNSSSQKGLVMCSSNKHHMIAGTIRMVYMIRRTMNSSLPIAIFHCSEIGYENQRMLKTMDSALTIHNFCERAPVLGKMTLSAARYRLRGFLCKIAALIHSPFEETIVVDADVVWFKKPEILFESKELKKILARFFFVIEFSSGKRIFMTSKSSLRSTVSRSTKTRLRSNFIRMESLIFGCTLLMKLKINSSRM